jgi:hypothetical protein
MIIQIPMENSVGKHKDCGSVWNEKKNLFVTDQFSND